MARFTSLPLAMAIAALAPITTLAKAPIWKPYEFEPLVSVPWEKSGVRASEVIETIFREPNIDMRAAVLREYLKIIPIEELGPALELSIELSGLQAPDAIGGEFLSAWARRDPEGCWAEVQPMFHLVVESEGWLSLDRWNRQIGVHDQTAVEKSSYWLNDKETLQAFVEGTKCSTLPEPAQARLIAQFSELWRNTFHTEFDAPEEEPKVADTDSDRLLLDAFRKPVAELEAIPLVDESGSKRTLAFEIAMRRWLCADPAAAPKILKHAGEQRKGDYPDEASNEFLLLWLRRDRQGLLNWIDTSPSGANSVLDEAMGMLMNKVAPSVRKRWLKAAIRSKDGAGLLIESWAEWDPTPALEAALATKNPETIAAAANSAAYGPFRSPNSCSFGQSKVELFDVSRIPKHLRVQAFGYWETILEQWGDNDIGGAARYGLNFILRTAPEVRKDLILLYSGHEHPLTDGDVRDRTFCALRFWAVVRPTEMRAWIAPIPDREMRDALMWLVANPWGWNDRE